MALASASQQRDALCPCSRENSYEHRTRRAGALKTPAAPQPFYGEEHCREGLSGPQNEVVFGSQQMRGPQITGNVAERMLGGPEGLLLKNTCARLQLEVTLSFLSHVI